MCICIGICRWYVHVLYMRIHTWPRAKYGLIWFTCEGAVTCHRCPIPRLTPRFPPRPIPYHGVQESYGVWRPPWKWHAAICICTTCICTHACIRTFIQLPPRRCFFPAQQLPHSSSSRWHWLSTSGMKSGVFARNEHLQTHKHASKAQAAVAPTAGSNLCKAVTLLPMPLAELSTMLYPTIKIMITMITLCLF